SSNTTHLAAICHDRAPTYHIEDASCIDPETGAIRFRPVGAKEEQVVTGWLPSGPLTVGVTAGASTPNNKIGETVERIAASRGCRSFGKSSPYFRMSLSGFHPAIERWFESRFREPTEPQQRAWPLIQAGRNALIAAPTGSGKTFAAFPAAIDPLLRQGLDGGGTLADGTQVVYVSPLKALSNDVQKNLAEPLAEIRRTLEALCLPDVEIRTLVRTGDTPGAERQEMVRRPPHILVTTPESLYLILTSERAREMLRGVRTVIVDEIHAVARDKRGSHLALSLERLEHLTARRLQRIGLSATQKPIADIAAFLSGSRHPTTDTCVVDSGHARRLDLA